MNNKVNLDYFTFFTSLAVIIAVCIPLLIFPVEGKIFIEALHSTLTSNLGFMNIWLGLGVFIVAIWFSFGKYGNILLGEAGEKPEFGRFQWASMLFCAGIGSGVMYWGSIEWAYYYMEPPFNLTFGSWEAIEYSATYGIYHWGPIGWALYSVPSIPIAYSYFVKKDKVFKLSESLKIVLGRHSDGALGKIVDVFFLFGAVGATATSLGLGTPMIAAGLSHILGVPVNTELKLLSLLIITILFSFSAYLGLKKGIQLLSTINVYLMFLILLFIFVMGPTSFMIKMGTTSFGIILQNFFRMSTWMDPVLESGFTENWTVFYWAWWIISSPIIGMFISRISRGRKVKEVILGSIIYGTLGCSLMFIILGNLGLHSQINGSLDVVSILGEKGAPAAIIATLETLKFSKVIIFLFTIVAIVFTSTTFDSISYILASTTSRELKDDQEPAKWNRLFWAFVLAFLPGTFIIIDGPLSTLQTASIITSIPIVFVIIGLIISFIRMVNEDGIM